MKSGFFASIAGDLVRRGIAGRNAMSSRLARRGLRFAQLAVEDADGALQHLHLRSPRMGGFRVWPCRHAVPSERSLHLAMFASLVEVHAGAAVEIPFGYARLNPLAAVISRRRRRVGRDGRGIHTMRRRRRWSEKRTTEAARERPVIRKIRQVESRRRSTAHSAAAAHFTSPLSPAAPFRAIA